MNLASSSTGIIKNIKKEPEDKKKKSTSGGDTGKDSAKDSTLSAAGNGNLVFAGKFV